MSTTHAARQDNTHAGLLSASTVSRLVEQMTTIHCVASYICSIPVLLFVSKQPEQATISMPNEICHALLSIELPDGFAQDIAMVVKIGVYEAHSGITGGVKG